MFPEYATPFIGRNADLQKALSLITSNDCRLLTLVGPGGVGKTRFAIELANQLIHQYDEGVYFIELQSVSDSEKLLFELADAIEQPLQGAESPLTQLVTAFEDRAILFMLDNFEHLIDYSHLLSDIISHVPHVDFLVTSREVLSLIEEWVYPMEGLDFPTTGDADHREFAAVELFLSHARRIQPQSSVENDSDAIGRICQMVQGMPLALEIAVTWLRSMTPNEIANEIEQNLDFLATSLRNMPERHRSMRAVFEQSWQMLSEDDRVTMAKLSVFTAGFDRDAARAIAGANVSELTRFVEKSLLYFDRSGRYSLHELFRQFAAAKLIAYDEHQQDVIESHAHYYAAYMQQRTHDLFGSKHSEITSLIDTEQSNVLNALDWALNHPHPENIKAILTPYIYYLFLRSRTIEGLNLCEKIIASLVDVEVEDKTTQKVLANAYTWSGWFSIRIGDMSKASQMAQTSIEFYEENNLNLPVRGGHTNDPRLVLCHLAKSAGEYEQAIEYAQQIINAIPSDEDYYGVYETALYLLADIYVAQRNYDLARQHADELYQLAKKQQNRWELANTNQLLGHIEAGSQNYTRSMMHYETAYTLRAEMNHHIGMAIELNHMAKIALLQNKIQQAVHYYKRSRIIQEDTRHHIGLLESLIGLGYCETLRNRFWTASIYYLDAIQIAHRTDVSVTSWVLLLNLAELLNRAEYHEKRAYFLQSIARSASNEHLQEHAISLLGHQLDDTRDQQSSADLQQLLREAQLILETSFNREDSGEDSLQDVDQSVLIEPLSEREIELLQLLANGLQNQEIALKLTISVNTVKTHLANIYGKLDVNNRTQAVTRAQELNIL